MSNAASVNIQYARNAKLIFTRPYSSLTRLRSFSGFNNASSVVLGAVGVTVEGCVVSESSRGGREEGGRVAEGCVVSESQRGGRGEAERREGALR